MHINIILIVAGVIFLAELPDKSLLASLILSSRFRGLYVWLGAAAAFLIHVIIAVTAGRLLTLLPHEILEIIIASLFLGGSALLFFGKQSLEKDEETQKLKSQAAHSFWKVFGTSFGVVFIGEWGDITQIAIANYAAKYHDTINVAIGGIIGLWLVTALAIIVGSKLLNLVPPKVLQRTTATILLLFGLFSLSSIFR